MVKKGLNVGDFFQEDGSWYLIEEILENGHYKSHRISAKEKEEIEAARERKAAEEAKKAEKERKAAGKAARKADKNSGSGNTGMGNGNAEETGKDNGSESADGKATEKDTSGNDKKPGNSQESNE